MSQPQGNYEPISLGLDWSREILAVRGYASQIGTSYDSVGASSVQFPSHSQPFQISSNSANDDVGGTGAIGFIVKGLDESYNKLIVTGNLSGTTPVSLIPNMTRVNSVSIATCGDTGGNEGFITVGNGVDTYRTIPLIDGSYTNVDQDCWATVPKGYVAQVTRLQISSKNTSPVQAQIWTKDNHYDNPDQLRYQCVCDSTPATVQFHDLKVSQKTDIVLKVKSSSAVEDVEAYLEYMTRYEPSNIA